jgi:PTS system glucitol/sorbitol-specific IIC component
MIYLVGDATPNGWDLGNATPMVATESPFVFTWTGNLTAGELKFSCDKQDDWNGAWFMSAKASAEPTGDVEPMLFIDKSSDACKAQYLGIAIGGVVSKFYAAGRETIDITIKSILPFMAFVSMILGIISASGIGDVIANTISPIASTLPGMLIISFICAMPFLSPVLGPGAVIAQIVGTLLGVQIGLGNIPPQYALPALFAIDAQVGGDFVPVGLSLGEADPETIELGVPAVLYSRVITGPAAVIIAYVASIGLYS